MAILVRRGQYADFDPSKLLPGEWAVVLAGDPGAKDGKSLYIAFGPGNTKRISTHDDMSDNIDNHVDEIVERLTSDIKEVIKQTDAAAVRADSSAKTADTARDAANSVAADLITKRDNGFFKGDKGDKGDMGDKGVTGEQGIQGIQGVKGDKGDKGNNGVGVITNLNPGMFSLFLDDEGHLMLTHNDGDPTPPLKIVDGNLIYEID